MTAGLPDVPSLLAVRKPLSLMVITGVVVAVLSTRSEPPIIWKPQVSSNKSSLTVIEVSSNVNVFVFESKLPVKS